MSTTTDTYNLSDFADFQRFAADVRALDDRSVDAFMALHVPDITTDFESFARFQQLVVAESLTRLADAIIPELVKAFTDPDLAIRLTDEEFSAVPTTEILADDQGFQKVVQVSTETDVKTATVIARLQALYEGVDSVAMFVHRVSETARGVAEAATLRVIKDILSDAQTDVRA